jgi:hypothetical protein
MFCYNLREEEDFAIILARDFNVKTYLSMPKIDGILTFYQEKNNIYPDLLSIMIKIQQHK